MSEHEAFAGLVELAAAGLGGRVIGASDDFFAGAASLLLPEPARFEPGRFTERGKWMDGWESRRKRGEGHDYCVIALGAPGHVRGFDIDTSHFIGNHPPFAAVDGLAAPSSSTLDELLRLSWRPLLPEVPLAPGRHNYFAAEASDVVSHVRLRIFPDGGVARLRVFGRVEPQLFPGARDERDEHTQREVPAGLVDLAALARGGRALACSDARFGGMSHLIMPGRAVNMGGGWETRRGRPPDHERDWLILELASRGRARVVEVDTAYFIGNFPESCAVEGVDWPAATATELFRSARWEPILARSKLSADSRHFFRGSDVSGRPVTHVRLTIFPDGGVSRFRLWGEPLV